MADVGRLAGVSSSTVSFVVNRTGGQTISAATRARVLDAVAALNYRPNRTARGLRTRRSATIGFVTDEIAGEPFVGATILGAHEPVWADGSLLLLANTTRDQRIVREVIDEMLDRPVDAILVAATSTRRLTLPDVLNGVPTLLVNGYTAGNRWPAVLPDDVAGGRNATDLLITAGHRRIAYLTGPSGAWATKARLRGFAAALDRVGLASTEQVVWAGDGRPDSGYDLTRRLLAEPDPPTAIMCGNDRMAVGAYLALGEAGVQVPDEMSVVGYDDQVDLAAGVRPTLSTIRRPDYQMGRWAAEQVIAGTVARLPDRTYLAGPPVSRRSVTVPRTGSAARAPTVASRRGNRRPTPTADQTPNEAPDVE